MTSRRDWQLQQLGITQWALRRPGALQGEIAISLPAHVRLIVVAEELPALNEPLMRDIFTRVDRESRSGFTPGA